MSSTIKKIFSSLMVLTLVLPLTALKVNAASDESNSPVFDNEGLQGDKFEIPTLQLGEKQSHEVVLSNGEVGIITVEKVADFSDEKSDIDHLIFFGWSPWHT